MDILKLSQANTSFECKMSNNKAFVYYFISFLNIFYFILEHHHCPGKRGVAFPKPGHNDVTNSSCSKCLTSEKSVGKMGLLTLGNRLLLQKHVSYQKPITQKHSENRSTANLSLSVPFLQIVAIVGYTEPMPICIHISQALL